MPFTGSHPAAVLPFLGTPLPMSALVAGSMAPDAAYYVPGLAFGLPMRTHEFGGVFEINLLVGLLLWAAWHTLVSGPALAAAPVGVRARWGHLPIGLRARLRRPVDLVLVPTAVVVGATTHVALDNVTHPWGWPVIGSARLRSEHLGVAGWTWAQIGFSVAGLLIIAAVLRRAWWRAPVAPVPPERILLPTSAVLAWWLIGAAAAVGAARGLYVVTVLDVPTEMVPWNVLTRSFGAAFSVGIALALVWHLRRVPRLFRHHTVVGSAPK